MSSTKGKEVLIIDDDIELRVVLAKILEALSMHVYGCESIEKAQEICKQKTPHLIILDINLIGETGFDFLKIRKEDPLLSKIPVIMMSARGDKKAVYDSITLGASDYIIKPFMSSRVCQKVRKVLSSHDQLKVKFSGNDLKKVSLSFQGDIEEISEASLQIESMVKLADKTKVKVHAELVDQIKANECKFSTVGASHNVSARRFGSQVSILGLDEKILKEIRKFKGFKG